jgi:fructose-specific component phosphotransferase system IIB-like protein
VAAATDSPTTSGTDTRAELVLVAGMVDDDEVVADDDEVVVDDDEVVVDDDEELQEARTRAHPKRTQ